MLLVIDLTWGLWCGLCVVGLVGFDGNGLLCFVVVAVRGLLVCGLCLLAFAWFCCFA